YRNPHLATGIQADGFPIEHGQAARYVKSADGHRDIGLAKPASDVESSWILIGLHADQSYEAEVLVVREFPQEPGNIDMGIELIDRLDVDIDICTQHSACRTVGCNAVDAGER